MIHECPACFNRTAKGGACPKCGVHMIAVLDRVDLTLVAAHAVEYSQAAWMAKVLSFAYLCAYCGNSLSVGNPDPRHELTKDHVIPIRRGGVDALWNLAPADLRCNRMKNNRTGYEFMLDRPGLCKSAVTRKENQQIVFSLIERLASLTQFPSQVPVQKKGMHHVLSTSQSIRRAG